MTKSTADVPRFQSWRFLVFYAVMAGIFSFYLLRLFNLQIVRGAEFHTRAEDNRTSTISVQTNRGIIYDRNGYVLARNVASYNIVITPAYLPSDNGAVQEIYRQLSTLIDVPVSSGVVDAETAKTFKPCQTTLGLTQIVYIWDNFKPYEAVGVKCNVDQSIAMVVQEKSSNWPGVTVQIVPVRDYPTGWLTSEIIGFLGPIPASEQQHFIDLGFVPGRDKVGYAGVENSLQEILSGKNGLRTVEVDVAGQVYQDIQKPVDPVPGENVRLTIDTRLQVAAKTALINDIQAWNNKFGYDKYTGGVVIAMNPKTGEILSMVSYPTYENNRMAQVIPSYYYEQLMADPQRPLFNQAISSEVPPGSVFKMGTALGILNEGVVTPTQLINDPGKITILEKFSPNDPGRTIDYVNWSYKTTGAGLGELDYLHGIAQSDDVYFYKVGGGFPPEVPVGLGIWRIGEYAKALGYGQISGIELPGEATGLIPDPNWKRVNIGENWSTGDTYISTIGQGYVLATPLQVLDSIATIANDGKHMQPTLVKDILDSEGNVIKPFKPVQLWDITVDPKIAIFDANNFDTGKKKTVAPWVIQLAKQGMQMVVSEGTAMTVFAGDSIQSAGKTGTAEYCDNVAQAKNLCHPGAWPAHAWYVGYAPYDNPEIAVVAFVYNGDEGATVAAPIVKKVLDAYFELKAIDQSAGGVPAP
jgi:penicillin-binding protein 2